MWKLGVTMAEGRLQEICWWKAGNAELSKHLPEAWELAVTRLQTHTVHDLHIGRSFLLGIAYRRVKTQSSLQGTALHITVRGTYSYRRALHGNSALLQ